MDSGAAGHPIQFDEPSHTYRVNGVVMPSVTQVLTKAGLIDTTWLNDEGRRRGRYVALVTQMYDEGTLDESKVHASCAGYLNAWKEFRRVKKFKIIERELPRHSLAMSYCGTPDLYVRWGTRSYENAILDIKTGSKMPHYPLQLAGYRGLFSPSSPRGFCVYLRKNGTFKLEEHSDLQLSDWNMFAPCVPQWHWKNENLK